MECKKVQDRLITEYGDKELCPGKSSEVERHLIACQDCREFFEAVRRCAVAPFKGAGEMHPDDAVWRGIQEKIEAERAHSEGGFWKLVDLFVPRFSLPVPLMRVAFVAALILGVVVLVKWPSSQSDPVYGYLSEQMTFMGELGSGNTDLMNGDLKDYEAVFEAMGA